MTIATIHDAPTTSSALEGAHVKGFVSSYAKCWEHFEAYMQNPDNTYQGFTEACRKEAAEQGIDIKLPAPTTFRNRIAKLTQAEVIPERTVSDKPSAVSMRKQRAISQMPKSGKCEQTANPPISHQTNDQQVSAPVQRSNTEHLLSRDIPAVQSNVGIYCGGRAEAVEALGTNHEGTNDAERTYSEICQLLNQARKKIYELEKYSVGPDVWASVRGHIGGCSDVANCHRLSEDVLPLRNITND